MAPCLSVNVDKCEVGCTSPGGVLRWRLVGQRKAHVHAVGFLTVGTEGTKVHLGGEEGSAGGLTAFL